MFFFNQSNCSSCCCNRNDSCMRCRPVCECERHDDNAHCCCDKCNRNNCCCNKRPQHFSCCCKCQGVIQPRMNNGGGDRDGGCGCGY